MHDVACEFARAVLRSKDAQKQLALSSQILIIRDLQQNATATATRTARNKRFNEQNNSFARAL